MVKTISEKKGKSKQSLGLGLPEGSWQSTWRINIIAEINLKLKEDSQVVILT